MADFSEVVEELTGAGYTEAEALLATVALAKIPQIDRLIRNPVVTDFIIGILLDGFEPTSEMQRAMVEGIAAFSKGEKQRYFMHTVEGMSFGAIAKEFGVSKGSVQQSIERARKKLQSQLKAKEQRNAL